MAIFDKIRTVLGGNGARKRGVMVGAKEEYYERMAAANGVDFGVQMSNDAAMRMTAVYAAIRLRSENVASLPKLVVDVENRTVNEHPVSRLIRLQPNGYTNPFDFWECVNASMDGWGNAYAIIERNNAGVPVALHQLLPSEVMVTMSKGKKYYKVYGNQNGFDGVYTNDEMCHFMQMTLNGITGLNPIEYNATALSKGVAATKFGAEFYRKGGNIRAVLEADGSMSDKEYINFIRHFRDSARNYETPLLEYGIKYKQVGISPISVQLLQTETFSIQDIARIFNVPPHMLSEMSHATFSNIEHQTIQFTMFSLRPAVKRIEVELESKLFFEDEKDRYDIKFNLTGLMRGDTASRTQMYATSIQNGWMSRNEVRREEGRPAIDGLDEMLYPGNLVVAGQEQEQEQSGKEE